MLEIKRVTCKNPFKIVRDAEGLSSNRGTIVCGCAEEKNITAIVIMTNKI